MPLVPFRSDAESAPALARISEVLQEAKRCTLCTHIAPDPDGVGSEIALAHALVLLGKSVRIVNVDGCPRICKGLAGADRIEHWAEEAIAWGDVVVALDAAARPRLGWPEDAPRPSLLINIDHHRSNTLFGDLNWVDASYPATGAMVFDLLLALGVALDAPMADALYMTLMADTNGFRVRIDGDVHRLAAGLIEHGASPARIARMLFAQRRIQAVRLLGALLAQLTLRDQGRSAWMIADRQLMARLGADQEDLEGVVEQALAVEGVEIAVLVRPLADGRYKASLRSWRCDVGRLAARFGGGGHPQAAGCPLQEEEIPLLQQAVSELLSVGT